MHARVSGEHGTPQCIESCIAHSGAGGNGEHAGHRRRSVWLQSVLVRLLLAPVAPLLCCGGAIVGASMAGAALEWSPGAHDARTTGRAPRRMLCRRAREQQEREGERGGKEENDRERGGRRRQRERERERERVRARARQGWRAPAHAALIPPEGAACPDTRSMCSGHTSRLELQWSLRIATPPCGAGNFVCVRCS